MNFSLLFSLGVSLSCGISFAQQQAPVQNAPTYDNFPSSKYESVKRAMKNKKTSDYDNALSRGVTLEWNQLPLVRRWHILISLDAELNEVIFVGESATNAFTTPALPSGEYFFVAEGLQGERLIGRTEPTKFSIGDSSLELEDSLPAPKIIFPAKDQMFQPEPKIRLSWESIPGAKSYRIQIWDDEQAKERLKNQKIPTARWITEVENNFLEIHDVPYSSFTYLQSGIYRWDVTPIAENNSKLGQMSSSRFEVSKKYHLEPQVFLRGWLERDPGFQYATASPIRGEQHRYKGISDGFHVEMENWFTKSWAFDVGGGIRILRLQPSGIYTSYDLQSNFNHRFHLSKTKNGLNFIINAGVFWQEFIQIDVEDTGTVTRPVSFGPNAGIKFQYRFESPFEIDISTKLMLSSLTFAKNIEISKSYTPLNFTSQIMLKYFLMNNYALLFSGTYEQRKVLYQFKPYAANALAQYTVHFIQLGLQIEY